MIEHDYLVGRKHSLADVAVAPYIICLDLLRSPPLRSAYSCVQKRHDPLFNLLSVEFSVIGSITPADKPLFAEIDVGPWLSVSQLFEQT